MTVAPALEHTAWDVISDPFGETTLCPTNGGAVDFEDAWRDYRTHLLVDRDCAPSTVEEYRSVLGRWYRFLNSQGVSWDQVDREHLERFLARPAATGRRKGRPISVNRRRTDIAAIHGLYRFAVLAEILDRDPFALVRLPRRRPATPRSFLLAELARILAGARDDDRLYLLAWLGYGAGLRRAEMAGLDLADFERQPWPGALRVVGKGGRERWVPLSAKVRRVLDRHLGDRANLTAGPLVANHTHPDRPLQPGTVGDLLADHIRSVGIDHGSAHWLRHSAATWAVAAREGANLNHVREFLGQADPRTTMSYVNRFGWNVRREVVDVIPDPEADPEATP
jgi:site-specific recombinase XerD